MWKEVLYQYSAQGRKRAHDFGLWLAKHRKYVLRHLSSTSVWQSDWGWLAVLKLRVVPCRRKISPQNLLRKCLSRSDTMERGMPWSLTTSWTKAAATVTAVKGCPSHIKGAYLLNLSTTTKMVSQPSDFGNPSMKSKNISSQTCCGIGRGCSRPLRDKVEYLFC